MSKINLNYMRKTCIFLIIKKVYESILKRRLAKTQDVWGMPTTKTNVNLFA